MFFHLVECDDSQTIIPNHYPSLHSSQVLHTVVDRCPMPLSLSKSCYQAYVTILPLLKAILVSLNSTRDNLLPIACGLHSAQTKCASKCQEISSHLSCHVTVPWILGHLCHNVSLKLNVSPGPSALFLILSTYILSPH
jgi:hypothetical protein